MSDRSVSQTVMKSTELITIRTYLTPFEAHLARTKLEGDGIQAFIQDEYLIGVHWYWSNALGGVKVQVPEPEAQRADHLLSGHSEDERPPSPLTTAEYTCPSCGSEDVDIVLRRQRLTYLLLLLLQFPVLRPYAALKCRACGSLRSHRSLSASAAESEGGEAG